MLVVVRVCLPGQPFLALPFLLCVFNFAHDDHVSDSKDFCLAIFGPNMCFCILYTT